MDYLDRVPTTEPTDKLDAYLVALASERRRVEELKERIQTVSFEALAKSDYPYLKKELEDAQKNTSMFYDALKHIALTLSAEGKDMPKEIGVKNYRKVVLTKSHDEMREWCLKNMPMALKVDLDILADAVRIGVVSEEIGYVETEKRAWVASNLSRLLETKDVES